MNKDYKSWHVLKNELNQKYIDLYFKEREIWFCSIGVNIGYEQDGWHNNFERPVLILKKFNHSIFWGLPLTTKSKKGSYYYEFYNEKKKYTVILSQVRLWDSKRLLRKNAVMPKNKFNELKNRMKNLLN